MADGHIGQGQAASDGQKSPKRDQRYADTPAMQTASIVSQDIDDAPITKAMAAATMAQINETMTWTAFIKGAIFAESTAIILIS